MEKMEKISRFLALCLMLIGISLLIFSCGTSSFTKQIQKNYEFTEKFYQNEIQSYGNAFMIQFEGNHSVVWHYEENKICKTRIIRSKIVKIEKLQCDSIINILNYEEGCYPECLDGDLFRAYVLDAKTRKAKEISRTIDINKLVSERSSSPFINQLKNHIQKLNIY